MLITEFKKVGGLDKAQRRKIAGYFYSVILGFYTLAVAYAMSKYNLTTNEWLLGLGAQATLVGLAYFAWHLTPRWFLRSSPAGVLNLPSACLVAFRAQFGF